MFSKQHLRQLTRISKVMQDLIVSASAARESAQTSPGSTRKRRRGKELIAFKRAIAAERKQGVAVSELALKYGVTPAYIYQLPVSRSAAVSKGVNKSRSSRMPATPKSKKARSSSTAKAEASPSVDDSS